MKRFASLPILLLIVTMLGCGGHKLTAVQGTITVDGQPLERGQIEFEPVEGEQGPLAAATITDGKYEVAVMPGRKLVRITGGKVIGQHHFTSDPRSPMVDDIESQTPACYNTESTLKREIVSGQSKYDFELKSSGE
jgi:hypothetical protein